jgi:hypothetical protein
VRFAQPGRAPRQGSFEAAPRVDLAKKIKGVQIKPAWQLLEGRANNGLPQELNISIQLLRRAANQA